ncbi:hypothetical protein DAPPUDRAFT_236019 [Daphnia pulex]|uniref:Uncharacterized protein n=1 Tax=Daphnia pulex TaxID=6669 RepID=E9FZP9_DAPPU|nr:hypothetical protein DAPPUDRAFT_236019 [Daphnia pulex]|eukprot:EFX87095.1 hypothetical protein DAPPUDRAFT_236019 [Daphnia pulex]
MDAPSLYTWRKQTRQVQKKFKKAQDSPDHISAKRSETDTGCQHTLTGHLMYQISSVRVLRNADVISSIKSKCFVSRFGWYCACLAIHPFCGPLMQSTEKCVHMMVMVSIWKGANCQAKMRFILHEDHLNQLAGSSTDSSPPISSLLFFASLCTFMDAVFAEMTLLFLSLNGTSGDAKDFPGSKSYDDGDQQDESVTTVSMAYFAGLAFDYKYYTTKFTTPQSKTYATPSYYTEAHKYCTDKAEYYTTTFAAPVYYTEEPKYYSAPSYYQTEASYYTTKALEYYTTITAPTYYTGAPNQYSAPCYYSPKASEYYTKTNVPPT